MPELFDTGEVRDEPTHWDALARRVAENARRSARQDAFAWLAQSRVGWIAASLVLITALVSIAEYGDSATQLADDWGGMLAPTDDVGNAMTTSETPPTIGALLLRNRI
jgi:hypothetical protein